jgi:hypothetical protein
MFSYCLLALLSSAALLPALQAGAADSRQQVIQVPSAPLRTHRPTPAAVLRPVEAAPLGSSHELLANSAVLAPRRHIEHLPDNEAPLKPNPASDTPHAVIAANGISGSAPLADRWVQPGRFYTVANRAP